MRFSYHFFKDSIIILDQGMINNYYKSSLVFAIFLHATLVLGLLIKFTTSRPVVLSPGSGFINATCVSESSAGGFSAPKPARIEKPKNSIDNKIKIDNKVKNNISDLQKNLLTEQSKELAELKQAKQEYKKIEAEKQKKQMQKMLQEQVEAEKQQLTEEQKLTASDDKGEVSNVHEAGKAGGAAMSAGEFDEYAAKIKQAISMQWIVPDGVSANTFCKLLIKIAPGGIVLDIVVVGSGGDSDILESSAKAAVTKASPLPVPQDLGAFDRFREIKLNFNPSGVVNSIV